MVYLLIQEGLLKFKMVVKTFVLIVQFHTQEGQLNLENQVQIVGYDKDIKKYLLEADYYICASFIEGLPFNILEAMYAGCVIFSSNIKGSADLIKDFETGILYDSNNINELITKFRILNNSMELKSKLAENARNNTDKYLFKNVFEINYKLIERLIEENGK